MTIHYMTVIEARKRFCPLAKEFCIAEECMFWVPPDSKYRRSKGNGDCALVVITKRVTERIL